MNKELLVLVLANLACGPFLMADQPASSEVLGDPVTSLTQQVPTSVPQDQEEDLSGNDDSDASSVSSDSSSASDLSSLSNESDY